MRFGLDMNDKRSRILGGLDPAHMTGLEIGALHNPIVRRGDGPVLYVDYAPTETLRANFQYPDASPDSIVDVDIVWNERPLRDCVDQPVDYVVASHVIEHVPDLIGWLQDLHSVIKPGGLLGLAVPDRRCTFDYRRSVSSPGEMVEAYLLGYRKPSLRQVFDAAALSKDTAEAERWEPDGSRNGVPGEVLGRMKSALALVRSLQETPRYNDAHCWIFTPAAFLDMAEMLAALELFPFSIERLYPTDGFEFVVRLRTVADPASAEILSSLRAARTALGSDGAQMGALYERIDSLQTEIATLRGSTSWRITAPLRRLLTAWSRVRRKRG